MKRLLEHRLLLADVCIDVPMHFILALTGTAIVIYLLFLVGPFLKFVISALDPLFMIYLM